MQNKKRVLNVEDNMISVKEIDGMDYISLTDMLRSKHGTFYVESWLRNRNTLEFLGIWESINNPNFNSNEFDEIKSRAGLNSFRIGVKEWSTRTNAIGLKAVAGRYGGTYAHKDIAFEFGTWISPAFKLYLIKDYERLKEAENNKYQVEWNMRRLLASTTYIAQTDAVRDKLAAKAMSWKAQYEYADEADIVNLAVFGTTASEWRKNNPERAAANENIRDTASIVELLILEEAQLQNATLIKQGLSKKDRLRILYENAKNKRVALGKIDPLKTIKKTDGTTYLNKTLDNE